MTSAGSTSASDTPPEARLEVRVPRLGRGRARVATLMAAGASVFAEKGVEAATMTEIAARAGASIGSLYQFFPSKDLLAAALHAEQLAALEAFLAELGSSAGQRSPASLADLLFDGLLQFLTERPAFVALADRRSVEAARKAESRTRLRAALGTLLAQTNPPLPAHRIEPVAALLLHLMKAAVAVTATDLPPLRDGVLDELRRMLRRHLAAPD